MIKRWPLFRYFGWPRVSIIDRYLTREFTGPFALATAAFVVIGMVDILFTLVDQIFNNAMPVWIVIRLLIYKIPVVMVLFFPMAVLFAVMLALVRMAKDNEITVLRCSGVNAGRVLIPLLTLGVLVSLLSFLINERVVPWTSEVSSRLVTQSMEHQPEPAVEQNVFFRDSESRFYYVNGVNRENGTMQNIMIYELKGNFPRFITAQQAMWTGKTWTLLDGYVQSFNADASPEYMTRFSQMTLHVDQDMGSFFTSQKTPMEMNSQELRTQIANLSKGGVSTNNLKVEYNLKKSLPAACLIFSMMGMAFCLGFVRSGKDWWGVIIAICVVVVLVGAYFVMMAVFRALGRSGLILPVLGAWIPNLIFGSISSVAIIYQSYFK